ncbi:MULTISPECIES: signal peptidase I [unclassified Arthrobacter]|uniref:signal peptidase I n=1 Tax=unclassified Arthrobacter TaxID=235627 RepID=UPI001490A524|nr:MULTISPECIES: signal peptidase I [unclassified Arthrobacter]MBE0009768.1 signal peptidase I [Arthrobacter sp. AET 35A]NOJ59991.1 signal peptidase I [Arthrobacter sp. 260]NOJ63540.1 signal peptidase I [Arthrobacter sp. 147(2020)]
MSSAARRRSPLRKAGAIATTLAAIATFLLAGVVLLPGLLGLERYVITGGSMSGTFERGAVVLAQVVPVDDLAVGDIITYMPPADSGISELVTHRIESITASATGPVFRTHGDANSAADSWTFQLTAPTQARVDVAVPHVGWAFIALADKDLRMLIIGVPAALIALMSVVEVTRVLSEPRNATAQPGPVPVAG